MKLGILKDRNRKTVSRPKGPSSSKQFDLRCHRCCLIRLRGVAYRLNRCCLIRLQGGAYRLNRCLAFERLPSYVLRLQISPSPFASAPLTQGEQAVRNCPFIRWQTGRGWGAVRRGMKNEEGKANQMQVGARMCVGVWLNGNGIIQPCKQMHWEEGGGSARDRRETRCREETFPFLEICFHEISVRRQWMQPPAQRQSFPKDALNRGEWRASVPDPVPLQAPRLADLGHHCCCASCSPQAPACRQTRCPFPPETPSASPVLCSLPPVQRNQGRKGWRRAFSPSLLLLKHQKLSQEGDCPPHCPLPEPLTLSHPQQVCSSLPPPYHVNRLRQGRRACSQRFLSFHALSDLWPS